MRVGERNGRDTSGETSGQTQGTEARERKPDHAPRGTQEPRHHEAELPEPPSTDLHPDAFACEGARPSIRHASPRPRDQAPPDHVTFGCTSKHDVCLTGAEQAQLEAWRQGQCRDLGVDPFRYRDVDPNAPEVTIDHAALAEEQLARTNEHLALIAENPSAAASYVGARLRGVSEEDAQELARDTAAITSILQIMAVNVATGRASAPRPGASAPPPSTRPVRPQVTDPPGATVSASRERHDVRGVDLRTQQLRQTGAPKLDLEHVLLGSVERAPGGTARATGFHHEGDGTLARVGRVLRSPDASGVYKARVQVRDLDAGAWLDKPGASSLFPRDWSRDRVVTEVQSAYWNSQPEAGKPEVLHGRSSSGVLIRMIVKDARMVTAYPLHEKEERAAVR